jgi:hypothetical protein
MTPCRLLDTRGPAGPLGGAALQPLADRAFRAAGQCGIPATARAIVANVTVIQSSAAGYVTLYSTGQSVPPTYTIAFGAGQTRSNSTVIPLGPATSAFAVRNESGGTVHLTVDVTGYFE